MTCWLGIHKSGFSKYFRLHQGNFSDGLSLFRTALLWITFFTSAASESVRPPTLLDIRDRLGCTTEEATYQFSVQAAGGLAGCLISGFLADRWECQGVTTYNDKCFEDFQLLKPTCSSSSVVLAMGFPHCPSPSIELFSLCV